MGIGWKKDREIFISQYLRYTLFFYRSLDDLLYFSLKVNAPSAPLDHNLVPKIKELNWMDVRLYNHFNHSLWKRIHASVNSSSTTPFFEELAQFRKLKQAQSRACTQWADLEENQHRKVIYVKYKNKKSHIYIHTHFLF